MNITKRTIPDTNYDRTRKKIDRVVIHWFGIGTLKSADARFSKVGEQSSAHYGISDNTVYQWVDEAHTAYHSGNYAMNQRSVGIEHDATTTKNATEATYKTSGALVRAICDRYSIPMDRTHIIAHNEVKATQCPGTLDLDKIISIAKNTDIIEPVEPITDKTKINLGGEWGEMEVQAIRSTLNDMRRDTTNAKAELESTIFILESERQRIIKLEENNRELFLALEARIKQVSEMGEENDALKKENEELKSGSLPEPLFRIGRLVVYFSRV